MKIDLKGQVALVTGATRGIGRAIAHGLAESGADLVVVGTTEEGTQKAAAELAHLGVRTMPLKMNVSDPASVAEGFKAAAERMGRIDILVNNAGITRDGLLMRMKDEDWTSVIDTNLKSVFLCSREAIKLMVRQKSGRIVNISSVVAFMGNAGQANYSAAKAGMIGLTKTIAKEYASRGVTVNAVAPGFIQTAMTDALSEGVRQEMLKDIPLGKFGSPEDVANSVVFLASPQAAYVTGMVVHVNGGMYM